MPNLNQMLKAEISRIARKEIRSDTAVLRRSSAQYRHDIADLKRQVNELERRVKFLEKQEGKRVKKKPPADAASNARYSPKWLRSHREKLGLSAADYSKLVGVSMLTIYNWEQEKSKPRAAQLAKLVEVRGLGKREAMRRLEMLENA